MSWHVFICTKIKQRVTVWLWSQTASITSLATSYILMTCTGLIIWLLSQKQRICLCLHLLVWHHKMFFIRLLNAATLKISKGQVLCACLAGTHFQSTKSLWERTGTQLKTSWFLVPTWFERERNRCLGSLPEDGDAAKRRPKYKLCSFQEKHRLLRRAMKWDGTPRPSKVPRR